MILSADVSGLNNAVVVLTFGPFSDLILPASVGVVFQTDTIAHAVRIGAALVSSPANDQTSFLSGEHLMGLATAHLVSVPTGGFAGAEGGQGAPFVVIPIDGRFAAGKYLAVLVSEDNLGVVDGHVSVGYFARPFQKYDRA